MDGKPSRRAARSDSTSRRDFVKLPLVAGAAGALLGPRALVATPASADEQRETIAENDPRNLKIARRVSSEISDDDLHFLKSLGLRWAAVIFGENEDLDYMRRTQERFAKVGIQIYAGLHFAYRNRLIQLGRPGRDKYIEQYQTFLRNLGKLNIPVSSYDFHPGNTYSTAQVERRGYTAREFDLKTFRDQVESQRFDRDYSADEMWDNYTYFIRAVLPVAEEADVRMSMHPDDPPIAKMNGVAKLITHYDGYRRAEEIANHSKHWGLEFCVGTWSEGGDKMGKDVFEMIEDFGRRGRIFVIHFRNVTAPLPHFVETFQDDGYQDMYRVMKTLRQVGYRGLVIPDHIPRLIGDNGIRPAGTAYCISYMRALLRCANQEVG